MGQIIVHEFTTLDGVVDAPTWTAEYGFDPGMGEALGAMMGSCEALLLGRRTYDMFAATWPHRSAEDDPGAPFFNESPKYVVSASAPSVDWENTRLLGGYDPDALRSLKDELAGNLYVSGSATLVQALLADGLVDELHLFVYPLTLGAGKKLFGDDANTFTLARCDSYEGGVVYLVYHCSSPAAAS
jgi:dihydrofolate reductase